MPDKISLPTPGDVSYHDAEHSFGFSESQHLRSSMEDSLAWHTLIRKELTAKGYKTLLQPEEIAHRLWTTYQLIDEAIVGEPHSAGSTATTTVYDGQGNLITATLADAATFAVIYGANKEVLNVVRLNSVTHKPDNPEEKERIEKLGGIIGGSRVYKSEATLESIAVSRALGDKDYKPLLCANATIDIHNIDKLVTDCNINPQDEYTIQIISTCDGFTDGAGISKQTKKDHEEYLLNILRKIPSPGSKSEEELAKELVHAAKKPLLDEELKAGLLAIAKKNNTGRTEEELISEVNVVFDTWKTVPNFRTCNNALHEKGISELRISYLRYLSGHTGSVDNISVAIQTIKEATSAFLLGVYDGHGGSEAAIYAAQNIARIFKEQCALKPEAYAAQEWSINKKLKDYNRDNKQVKKLSLPLTLIQGAEEVAPLPHPDIARLALERAAKEQREKEEAERAEIARQQAEAAAEIERSRLARLQAAREQQEKARQAMLIQPRSIEVNLLKGEELITGFKKSSEFLKLNLLLDNNEIPGIRFEPHDSKAKIIFVGNRAVDLERAFLLYKRKMLKVDVLLNKITEILDNLSNNLQIINENEWPEGKKAADDLLTALNDARTLYKDESNDPNLKIQSNAAQKLTTTCTDAVNVALLTLGNDLAWYTVLHNFLKKIASYIVTLGRNTQFFPPTQSISETAVRQAQVQLNREIITPRG